MTTTTSTPISWADLLWPAWPLFAVAILLIIGALAWPWVTRLLLERRRTKATRSLRDDGMCPGCGGHHSASDGPYTFTDAVGIRHRVNGLPWDARRPRPMRVPRRIEDYEEWPHR